MWGNKHPVQGQNKCWVMWPPITLIKLGVGHSLRGRKVELLQKMTTYASLVRKVLPLSQKKKSNSNLLSKGSQIGTSISFAEKGTLEGLDPTLVKDYTTSPCWALDFSCRVKGPFCRALPYDDAITRVRDCTN